MSSKFLSSLDIIPEKEDIKEIKKRTDEFIAELKSSIKKNKVSAEIFIAGSFAKDTMLKGEYYEVDLFVRFKDSRDISNGKFEKVVNDVCKKHFQYKQIHGSRDYFFVKLSENIVLEIVPVLWVRNPRDAENVTDLSYSHVKYVKSKISRNKSLKKEILLAKEFCKAQGVYGAESYIHGFSGYALECLVINYGSFAKFLNVVSKSDKIIIDPGKHYKNKQEVLISLNESKIQGPIILVDPTWKERNVLAALDWKTYEKTKEIAKRYLKKPDLNFFKKVVFSEENFVRKAEKSNSEMLSIKIKTSKQEGDIAGTKLKKFFNFVNSELDKRFKVLDSHFEYSGIKEADLYYSVKSKKNVKKGPPVKMKENVVKFKKMNKKTFVKSGSIYAEVPEIKVNKWLEGFLKVRGKQIKDMDISEIGY